MKPTECSDFFDDFLLQKIQLRCYHKQGHYLSDLLLREFYLVETKSYLDLQVEVFCANKMFYQWSKSRLKGESLDSVQKLVPGNFFMLVPPHPAVRRQ